MPKKTTTDKDYPLIEHALTPSKELAEDAKNAQQALSDVGKMVLESNQSEDSEKITRHGKEMLGNYEKWYDTEMWKYSISNYDFLFDEEYTGDMIFNFSVACDEEHQQKLIVEVINTIGDVAQILSYLVGQGESDISQEWKQYLGVLTEKFMQVRFLRNDISETSGINDVIKKYIKRLYLPYHQDSFIRFLQDIRKVDKDFFPRKLLSTYTFLSHIPFIDETWKAFFQKELNNLVMGNTYWEQIDILPDNLQETVLEVLATGCGEKGLEIVTNFLAEHNVFESDFDDKVLSGEIKMLSCETRHYLIQLFILLPWKGEQRSVLKEYVDRLISPFALQGRKEMADERGSYQHMLENGAFDISTLVKLSMIRLFHNLEAESEVSGIIDREMIKNLFFSSFEKKMKTLSTIGDFLTLIKSFPYAGDWSDIPEVQMLVDSLNAIHTINYDIDSYLFMDIGGRKIPRPEFSLPEYEKKVVQELRHRLKEVIYPVFKNIGERLRKGDSMELAVIKTDIPISDDENTEPGFAWSKHIRFKKLAGYRRLKKMTKEDIKHPFEKEQVYGILDDIFDIAEFGGAFIGKKTGHITTYFFDEIEAILESLLDLSNDRRHLQRKSTDINMIINTYCAERLGEYSIETNELLGQDNVWKNILVDRILADDPDIIDWEGFQFVVLLGTPDLVPYFALAFQHGKWKVAQAMLSYIMDIKSKSLLRSKKGGKNFIRLQGSFPEGSVEFMKENFAVYKGMMVEKDSLEEIKRLYKSKGVWTYIGDIRKSNHQIQQDKFEKNVAKKNIKHIDLYNINGQTILHQLAKDTNISRVTAEGMLQFLGEDFDLERADVHGVTPLMEACRQGNMVIMELLLKNLVTDKISLVNKKSTMTLISYISVCKDKNKIVPMLDLLKRYMRKNSGSKGNLQEDSKRFYHLLEKNNSILVNGEVHKVNGLFQLLQAGQFEYVDHIAQEGQLNIWGKDIISTMHTCILSGDMEMLKWFDKRYGEEVWMKNYPKRLTLQKIELYIRYDGGNTITQKRLSSKSKFGSYLFFMTNDGRNVVQMAIDSGNSEMLQYILRKGKYLPKIIRGFSDIEFALLKGYKMVNTLDSISIFKKEGISDETLSNVHEMIRLLRNASPKWYKQWFDKREPEIRDFVMKIIREKGDEV